jgi:hypothetical protein
VYQRENRAPADLPPDLAYVLITGDLEDVAPLLPDDAAPVPSRFEEGTAILLYAVNGPVLDVANDQPLVRIYQTASEYRIGLLLPLNTDRRYLPSTDEIEALFAAAKP